jgi:hypothetical protein
VIEDIRASLKNESQQIFFALKIWRQNFHGHPRRFFPQKIDGGRKLASSLVGKIIPGGRSDHHVFEFKLNNRFDKTFKF